MRKAYVGVLVMMCGLSWPLARASAQTLTPAQVTALQNLLNCVSVQGTDMIVKGCNVHIRNGTNATTVKNGTGNLIIGYNEAPQERTGPNDRSRSQTVMCSAYHAALGAYGWFP